MSASQGLWLSEVAPGKTISLRRFLRPAIVTQYSHPDIEKKAVPKNSRHNDRLSSQGPLPFFPVSPTDARAVYTGREVGRYILLKRKAGTGVAYT